MAERHDRRDRGPPGPPCVLHDGRRSVHLLAGGVPGAGRQGVREDRPGPHPRGPGEHGLAALAPPLLLETSRPGIFAVGDVRSGNIKRVASAVGEGSISIQLVHRVLAGLSSAGCATAAAPLAWVPRPILRLLAVDSCQSPADTASASLARAPCSGATARPRTRSRSRSTTRPPRGPASLDWRSTSTTSSRAPPRRAGRRGPTDGLTHLTFEPHLGITGWWELGVYLQSVLGRRRLEHRRVEASHQVALPESVGPWASRSTSRWPASPSSTSRTAGAASCGPSSTPGGAASTWPSTPSSSFSLRRPRRLEAGVRAGDQGRGRGLRPGAVGLEDVLGLRGEFGELLPPTLQTHRLFVVTDVLVGAGGLNFGVGRNVTGPDGWIVKAIVSLTPPGRKHLSAAALTSPTAGLTPPCRGPRLRPP